MAQISAEDFMGGSAPQTASAAPSTLAKGIMSIDDFAGPSPKAQMGWAQSLRDPTAVSSRIKSTYESARKVGKEAVAVEDIVGGFPAFLAQMGATGVADVYAALAGDQHPLQTGSRIIEAAAKTPWMQALLHPVSTLADPVSSRLDKLMKSDSPQKTHVEKVGEHISDLVENAANYWTEKTGSAEAGEAVRQGANIAMAKAGDVVGDVYKAGREAIAKRGGKPSAAPEVETPPTQPAPVAPTPKAASAQTINEMLNIKGAKEQEAYNAKRRVDVRAAFKEDPDYANYLDHHATEMATYRELWGKEQAERDAAEAAAKEAAAPKFGADLGSTPKTRIVDPTIIGEKAPELQTALEKQRAGQSFNMTAEEKVALRDFKNRSAGLESGKVDPELLVKMGALATGGAAAYWLAKQSPEDRDKYLGLGVGLLGMTTGHEAVSALGPALEKYGYTTRVLDRLGQNKTEFSRAELEQTLKQQDIPAAEKEIFGDFLAKNPEGKIKTKDLVDHFKLATGDFRLEPKETQQHADYGLEAINRVSDESRVYDEDGRPLPGEPDLTPATTTLYRLPEHMEMSDDNHFKDSRLFGWTRSFDENGVKHVVEIQSDLAQHAKELSIEKAKELYDEYQVLKSKIAEADKEADKAMSEDDVEAWRVKSQAIIRLKMRQQEINAALSSGAAHSQINPMLKNWPRRLIQEELARARTAQLATSPEPSVIRFATADTVAKVEGWPDNIARLNESQRRIELRIKELEQIQKESRGTVGKEEFDTMRNMHKANSERLAGNPARFSPAHQSIYNRYAKDITNYLKSLGGKEVTDAQGHTWIEVPTTRGPAKMFGKVDPKLLALMGGAAAGVYLDQDSPLVGAFLGALGTGAAIRFGSGAATATFRATQAALKPGTPWERMTAGVKELTPGPISRLAAEDTRLRVKDEMDAAEVYVRREEYKRNVAITKIVEALPAKADREAVVHAIERGSFQGLSPKQVAAAQQVKAFFSDAGSQGLAATVLDDLIPRYVTHVYGRDAVPFIQQLMAQRTSGAMSTVFGKSRRGPPTIAEINQFMLERGQKPITADPAEIMEIYGASLSKAVANRTLVDTLKARTTPMEDGYGKKSEVPLVGAPGKMPKNYVSFGRQNLVAHPDIVPALRFAFDSESPVAAIRAIEAVNVAAKRSAISFSLFHAKSLVDAMAGAAKLNKKNLAIGAGAGAAYGLVTGDDPVTYAQIGAGIMMAAGGLKIAGQSVLPKVFGENPYVKALRKGDPAMAKLIDLSFQGGLKYTLPRGELAVSDVDSGFYRSLKWMQGEADKIIPGSAKAGDALAKVNHAVDKFMWERLHTGMKMQVFAEKMEELTANNAKAAEKGGKLRTEKELAEIAASYANDVFGGLNWRRIAEGVKSRWGRDLTFGALNPAGQRVMRLAMFAPDWTLSTTRAAAKAFGEGSGVKGLANARELADLHRQYIARSAFYYLMVGDGLNYAFTGHHVWDNKDPTFIELPDGRRMQYSKHTMEPVHWLTQPVKQGLNKLGQIPKEAINQMLDTEYLSPRTDRTGSVVAGPKMKESRPQQALQSMSPIGVQQLSEGGAAAGVMGALGMPIYGKSRGEVERAKQLKKLRAELSGK